MKKLFKSLAAVLTASLMLCSAAEPLTAFAADQAEASAVGAENVINVSSNEIASNGTYSAIQTALDKAKAEASSSNVYNVVVAPGSYTLNRGLRIYANTTLTLTGVTITRDKSAGSNMIRTGDEDTLATGRTGYYYENITINGGTLNANGTENTMIKVAHAKNFKMTNVNLKNLNEGHMMEVAGVDGFTARGCTFTDQVLSPKGVGFEAIQFDVLKDEHIVNCRSEDLPMKNILVENCTFTNCPRGVGSHTAIHNRPHDGIVIRNNTFKNMHSVAIQGLNWVNCTITGNVIDGAARGIAVYAVMDEGSGTFLPSELAKEGNTTAHASDSYQAPQKANILIAYNKLKNCGTLEDIYSHYEVSGISAMGYKFSSTTPRSSQDGSGRLPAGSYYCDGVTIRDNSVDVWGSGVRVENCRNTIVRNNNLSCGRGKFDSKNYYGIVFRNDVRASQLNNNYIAHSMVNGIQIDDCTVTDISSNEITDSGKYGMGIYGSTIGTITSNTVTDVGTEGIALLSGSNITGRVSENRVSGGSDYGIHASSDTKVAMIEKNTTVNCGEGIGYSRGPGLVTVGANYEKTASLYSLETNEKMLGMGVGTAYRIGKSISPANAISGFSYSSGNSSVAEVDHTGLIFAKSVGETTVTVKSDNGKTATVSVIVNESGEPSTSNVLAVPKITKLESTAYGVKLTWDAVKGANRYRVYYKGASGSWKGLGNTSSTSFIDDDVNVGSTYTYTLRCIDNNGDPISDFDGAGWSHTYTGIEIPHISKLESAPNGVKLSWNAVDGANKYRLYYKNSSGGWTTLGDTVSTTFTDEEVNVGTTYTYTIRSLNGNNRLNSGFNSTGWSHKYQGIDVPQLTSLDSIPEGIKLGWEAVEGASGYRVYYKNRSGGWSTLGDTTKTSITDTDVSLGTEYTYTIRSLSASGRTNSGFDPNGWSKTYDGIAAPELSGFESNADGVKLSWQPVEGAAGYRLYYKNSKGGWNRLGDTNKTSFVDSDVTFGSTYTYTIRSLNSNGVLASGFEPNGWAYKYMGVQTPEIKNLTSTTDGIRLEWNAIEGVSSYRVYYKNGSGGWSKLKDVTGTSCIDEKVAPGRKETYTIRCLNTAGKTISDFNPHGWWHVYEAQAPRITKIESTTSGNKITWTAIPGVKSYRVYYKNGKGGWSRFGSDAATNSFTDTAVKSGVPDTYTVRCLDSNGNTISDYNHTGWSHTFIGTPKITSLSSTSGGVKITWGKVNGAVKYRVFYKGRNGWTRLGDTTSTSFTDSVVSNGSTYTYTVRCIDNNGNFVSGYDNTGKSIKYVK